MSEKEIIWELGQHLIHRQNGDGYNIVRIETTTIETVGVSPKVSKLYIVRKDDNAQTRVAEMSYNEKMLENIFVNNEKWVDPMEAPFNRLESIDE